MRFLPLSGRVLRIVLIASALLLTGLIWGSYHYPEMLWAPGDLSKAHATIDACSACHQAFKGPVSGKCQSCHTVNDFDSRAKNQVSLQHRQWVFDKETCLGCHVEHRGAASSITVGVLENPHGTFIFRATGTRLCSDCHDFSPNARESEHLLKNAVVFWLRAEGEGRHKPGKMAFCKNCHHNDNGEFD